MRTRPVTASFLANGVSFFALAFATIGATIAAPAQQPAAPPANVADLPLIEAPSPMQGRTFAVFLSGDGGWAPLDKAVAAALRKRGVGVVGIHSARYFWQTRTPDGTAGDLARIVRHYRAAWRADSVVVIGYSRGAGVVPFMVNRASADVRARIALVALIGAEHTAGFKFHISDLWERARKGEPPVMPEIEKLGALRVVCFYGAEEPDTLCPELQGAERVSVKLGGGHHFDGNYSAIGDRIAEELRRRSP